MVSSLINIKDIYEHSYNMLLRARFLLPRGASRCTTRPNLTLSRCRHRVRLSQRTISSRSKVNQRSFLLTHDRIESCTLTHFYPILRNPSRFCRVTLSHVVRNGHLPIQKQPQDLWGWPSSQTGEINSQPYTLSIFRRST